MPISSFQGNHRPIHGLMAAVFTPFHYHGSVNFEMIPKLVDYLYLQGIRGIYICGSTGEGPSLTLDERKKVTEYYLQAAGERFHKVVQIGHSSLRVVQNLADHAAIQGADAISAVAPYYFKPGLEELLEFFAEVTTVASHLPFYYYHVPAITGLSVDPVAFLEQAAERLPSLKGIKFTDTDLSVFTACQEVADGSFEVLFGRDEMYLPALAAGAKGVVGSTYNFAPALYQRIHRAFEKGDHGDARRWQKQAVAMIRLLIALGGEAAIKYPMRRLGLDCGQRRLPMRQLSAETCVAIDRALDDMNFDDWAIHQPTVFK